MFQAVKALANLFCTESRVACRSEGQSVEKRVSEVAFAGTAEDTVTLALLQCCCHSAKARQREGQVHTKVREPWGPVVQLTPLSPLDS